MLHATEVLGGEAYDVQGNFVGRVTELFIEPADQPNRVARYLLGRGKYLPLLARHDQVSSVAPGVIKLNVEEKDLEHFHRQRGLAGGAQGFAGPADHRYAGAQGGARERRGPGRAAHRTAPWSCALPTWTWG